MAPTTQNDLLAGLFATIAIYCLPIAVLVASGFFSVGNEARTRMWAVALITMGVGCPVNALRCGRVHCYAAGPFFLLMAGVAVLYGLGIAPLGARGWNTIALVTLTGGIALYYLPELCYGRYGQKLKLFGRVAQSFNGSQWKSGGRAASRLRVTPRIEVQDRSKRWKRIMHFQRPPTIIERLLCWDF